MNNLIKHSIACELVRIAAEVSGIEEFDRIDRMNMGQLVDMIKRNKSNYTSMSNSLKIDKFKDMIDMSKPLRGATVKDLMRMLAKFGVDIEEEEKGNEQ